jgi:hypothetical protein
LKRGARGVLNHGHRGDGHGRVLARARKREG